ncbi:unnamed protein product [Arctia plantaginis]|uniref:Uncharacterized protein n=1 Tax=Arctia plantaginis TaxID=874455 RepID=A0A8S1A060_ARCPL|nr:unnamed protein product [Arctia plantaginis]CAB3239002.1 unnamed protein product [Arctia plantaginis]
MRGAPVVPANTWTHLCVRAAGCRAGLWLRGERRRQLAGMGRERGAWCGEPAVVLACAGQSGRDGRRESSERADVDAVGARLVLRRRRLPSVDVAARPERPRCAARRLRAPPRRLASRRPAVSTLLCVSSHITRLTL